MNYCSLEDAFQMAPGSEENYSSKSARKEERRKAKKCKGPSATFLGVQVGDDKDPDRQRLERPRDIPAMNSNTGLRREHVPSDAPLGMEPFQDVNGNSLNTASVYPTMEAKDEQSMDRELSRQHMADLLPRTDDDPVGDRVRSTLPTPGMLAQAVSSNYTKKGGKGFFGADPTDDDSFADYQPDAKNYLMEPDFLGAFKGLNPGSGNSSTLPVPSVRDVWKPMTPAGVTTAFAKKLPSPGGEYVIGSGREKDESYLSMSQKMDRILARLDDLQRGPNPEQSQKEILMFVASGVFVLFMMDLLVRRGSSLRFLNGL
jgi:hypothetical protein